MTLRKTLFWALAAGLGALTAAATTYDRMYVFGDSYSDIGAGYEDGNGPTAVAYLAWKMGLEITIPQAAGSAGKSIDFAVSGARTGEGLGRKVQGALIGYGMINQVDDFAARVRSGEIKFDPDTTLFFLAGGLNDRGLPLQATLDNLHKEIGELKDLGGRHFTLAQLPEKIPQFATAGTRLNPSLPGLAADVRANLRVDAWINHWGADFDEVIQHPGDYGLVNVTSACAGREIFNQDAVPKGDPTTYFFYHEGHPSTATHRIVGLKLADEVRAH
ncbi:MAG TPA: SGNH/GDSL hydrolase family protein [Opitutaceae bacterium]|nr:SGNH/GDSL hydrolase family protein [Opitutaceae bacterium]